MWPKMTCAVHILAYTIRTSLLLRFSFCFASLGQERLFISEFFVLLYTRFFFRFGRHATDLAACYRFRRHATDFATVPQIRPSCHIFRRRATDWAPVAV